MTVILNPDAQKVTESHQTGNISADYKIPVLYLTYDSQTSDTGLETRVEAFYDMISMRKKVV